MTRYKCPDCGWELRTRKHRVRCSGCGSLNLERQLPSGRWIKADEWSEEDFTTGSKPITVQKVILVKEDGYGNEFEEEIEEGAGESITIKEIRVEEYESLCDDCINDNCPNVLERILQGTDAILIVKACEYYVG